MDTENTYWCLYNRSFALDFVLPLSDILVKVMISESVNSMAAETKHLLMLTLYLFVVCFCPDAISGAGQNRRGHRARGGAAQAVAGGHTSCVQVRFASVCTSHLFPIPLHYSPFSWTLDSTHSSLSLPPPTDTWSTQALAWSFMRRCAITSSPQGLMVQGLSGMDHTQPCLGRLGGD